MGQPRSGNPKRKIPEVNSKPWDRWSVTREGQDRLPGREPSAQARGCHLPPATMEHCDPPGPGLPRPASPSRGREVWSDHEPRSPTSVSQTCTSLRFYMMEPRFYLDPPRHATAEGPVETGPQHPSATSGSQWVQSGCDTTSRLILPVAPGSCGRPLEAPAQRVGPAGLGCTPPPTGQEHMPPLPAPDHSFRLSQESRPGPLQRGNLSVPV